MAWELALDLEAAEAAGDDICGAALDWRKAFDNVPLCNLDTLLRRALCLLSLLLFLMLSLLGRWLMLGPMESRVTRTGWYFASRSCFTWTEGCGRPSWRSLALKTSAFLLMGYSRWQESECTLSTSNYPHAMLDTHRATWILL